MMTIQSTNENTLQTTNTAVQPAVTAAPEVKTKSKGSKLAAGILAGAVIGGLVTLFDKNTRNQVKKSAAGIKDSSAEVFTQVKENPGEVKNQVVTQFKSAADSLKDAINEAKRLYDRLNEDVRGNVSDVIQASNETLSTAKDAQQDLASIGSKVKEAGAELTGGNESDTEKAPETPQNQTSIPGTNAGKF
ncbi:YtxH domain-containing protein [Metabacillus indicus]